MPDRSGPADPAAAAHLPGRRQDHDAQEAVTDFLIRLYDPAFVAERRLNDFRMLDRGNIRSVNCSARLELGSTAKLRTLGGLIREDMELKKAS